MNKPRNSASEQSERCEGMNVLEIGRVETRANWRVHFQCNFSPPPHYLPVAIAIGSLANHPRLGPVPSNKALWKHRPLLLMDEISHDEMYQNRTIFRLWKVGMWKRSIFMPLPQLPLPLPFCSSNTSSYPTHQIESGQSLLHP